MKIMRHQKKEEDEKMKIMRHQKKEEEMKIMQLGKGEEGLSRGGCRPPNLARFSRGALPPEAFVFLAGSAPEPPRKAPIDTV